MQGDNSPQITTSSTSQVEPGQGDGFSTRSALKVTLLGGEWNSSEGGLSTLNRELAISLSKHPKLEVTLLVPVGVCKDEEKREAGSYGITIVEAKEQTTALSQSNCRNLSCSSIITTIIIIILHEKFLKFDWLRAVVL